MARLPRPAPTLSGGGRRAKYAKTIPNPTQKKKNRNTTSRRTTPHVQETDKKTTSSAAEKRKLAMHGGDSRFIHVTLDPPCKRASQVNLKTPRVSYSSRRSRVARRRKRKLDRSRVVRISNLIYPIRWRSHADFPEPPQTVVALAPNVGLVRKHGVVVSAGPICVRHVAIAGCQKSLAVTPRKFPLCAADSHPAVQAVGLAVLVRGAGSVAQNFVATKLEVQFPFPRWTR